MTKEQRDRLRALAEEASKVPILVELTDEQVAVFEAFFDEVSPEGFLSLLDALEETEKALESVANDAQIVVDHLPPATSFNTKMWSAAKRIQYTVRDCLAKRADQ